MDDDGHGSDVSLSDNDEVPMSCPPSPKPAIQDEQVHNWTVKAPGKVSPPTTNDYRRWTIAQLRKECTARGKKIKRMPMGEKEARISWLQENDLDRQLIEMAVDPENALPPRLRKTNNSTIRLLNVLFSDKFAERLGRSEDPVTRAELDTRAINSNSKFWKDVEVEFCTNTSDYNGLYEEDDPQCALQYVGLEP